MTPSFHFFPDAASRTAEMVDWISLTLLGIGTVFSLGIATAIVFFSVRYWHTRDVNRVIHESNRAHWGIEIFWSLVPLAILLVMFWWGASVYIKDHQPPKDALEVSVVAKQWMWKLSHASGPREINALHLPVGRPVRLTMISQDVIHSFYVPAFRVKQDVLPGRYATMWFEPTRPGTYHLFCAEYCGTDHAKMAGQIIVQSPEDYAVWLAKQPKISAAQRGRRLLDSAGCLQCHGAKGNQSGPPLTGLYERRFKLADGSEAFADANYLRQSILNPNAESRPGYKQVMPSYEGKLDAEQVLDIIAYLRSVADTDGPLAGPGEPGESDDLNKSGQEKPGKD